MASILVILVHLLQQQAVVTHVLHVVPINSSALPNPPYVAYMQHKQ